MASPSLSEEELDFESESLQIKKAEDERECSTQINLELPQWSEARMCVNAEVLLKATNVDGVYDEDPKTNPNARLLHALSYQDVTTKDLSVMDMTAITLCQENDIPVVVFNLNKPGNIAKAIFGEKVGTFIGRASERVAAL
ncbi:hypothetical protein KSP40_PGU008413 [Platanthera guangdongensis]|uniref:UMP kinase n=1 Tax=Platanthera guangdongensis TaxID=2320717 RepID=A0ABR2M497_9ASPA